MTLFVINDFLFKLVLSITDAQSLKSRDSSLSGFSGIIPALCTDIHKS